MGNYMTSLLISKVCKTYEAFRADKLIQQLPDNLNFKVQSFLHVLYNSTMKAEE